MVFFTNNWLLDFTVCTTATLFIFITWIKWSHTYWQRRGITSPPTTFFIGNSKSLLSQVESFGDFTAKLYNSFKRDNGRHGGLYFLFMPLYMPVDPEIVKSILQSDFTHFMDRGVYFNERDDPLSAHLFSLKGAKWRNLRTKLTPTFTSGKMKMMFETLVKCGDQLITEMDKHVGAQSVNIKDFLAGFTTDVIGNCAFGIDCNSMKNPNNEFSVYLNIFFTHGFWKNVIELCTFVAPGLMRVLRVKTVTPDTSKFFMKIVKDTVKYREENNVYRKDFMHLLLQLKNRGQLADDEDVSKSNGDKVGREELTLTVNDLAAQSFLFFLAGYETSSTTMTFCLLELAFNPEIQEKVRQEVVNTLQKHGNNITYDGIMEMTYMDKVINETLRKYPPLPCLNRICTKEYKVPGTNLVLEKGTKVLIPVQGIQHDPEYYPNPEIFDPERFAEDKKNERHSHVFLPFGEGPRSCIGLRFGMMQAKVGLSFLLKNYKFSVSPKTKLPIKFDPRSFIMTTEGGIWLDYVEVGK